jgi:uncharacterized protein YjhX (UPF0386 family)
MNKPMFEYTKEILTKVSFDKKLFKKELVKGLKWLKSDERKMLMVWCLATFGHKYSDVLTEVFKKITRQG